MKTQEGLGVVKEYPVVAMSIPDVDDAIEIAVESERQRIYAELSVMKGVYETMDTGSALVALMNKDVDDLRM